jgi:hypothetical protein
MMSQLQFITPKSSLWRAAVVAVLLREPIWVAVEALEAIERHQSLSHREPHIPSPLAVVGRDRQRKQMDLPDRRAHFTLHLAPVAAAARRLVG